VSARRPSAEGARLFDQRERALSWILDALVMGADEAPNRQSAGLLRDAAARVGDALSVEERGALS